MGTLLFKTKDKSALRPGPREIHSWLLILCFFAFIAMPAIVELAEGGKVENIDNRVLAPSPSLASLKDWRHLPSIIEAWINDHFGMHANLIHLNSIIRYALGVSSTPNVVMGSDKWLFYTSDKLLEQHTGSLPFTAAELDAWVKQIEADRDWLKARGMRFYIMVAPDKNTIYPEKLPDYPRGKTRLDQLTERLRTTDLAFIDPRPALMQAKAMNEGLYYQGDTHWLPRGAYLAYDQLMRRIRLDFPNVAIASLKDYRASVESPPGNDLAVLLGLAGDLHYRAEVLKRVTASHQLSSRVDNHRPGWGWPVKYIQTDRADSPRLLVFGDSFTDYVLGPDFLYESFRDPVYTHHNLGMFDFRLVDETKPDIVLFIFAERYLAYLPGLPLLPSSDKSDVHPTMNSRLGHQ
jgi:alginate O-acetyltransferase complex protein AlgJ